MARCKRVRLLHFLAGAAMVTAGLPTGASASASPETADPRLLRVRVAAEEIDPALDAILIDGVLYLPAVRLAELIERPHRLSEDGQTLLVGGREPTGDTPISLTAVGAGAIIEDGAVFIPMPYAEAAFSIDLEADLERDVLTVRSTGTALPVEERLAREAGWRRRAIVGTEPEAGPPPVTETPWALYAPVMGDVAVNARTDSDGAGSVDYNALIIGELAWLTHELYVSGPADGGPDDLRLTSGRRDYGGGVFGIPSLYEAAAGDVMGYAVPMVGRAPMGRGVSLGGRPLTQPAEFDVTRVEGDALPGWDAELYRNDELVSIQRIGPDGHYRFEDVALSFGRNRLLVRLYGPQGQMRETVQTIGIGADMAPPGAVRWAAFVNQPDRRLFEGLLDRRPRYDGVAGSVMLDVGLTRSLSVGAFAARSPESSRTGSDFASYGGVVVRTTVGPVAVEAAAAAREAGGWAWRAGGLTSLGPASLTVRHEEYLDGYRSLDTELAAIPLRRFSRARLSTPLSALGPGLGSISLSADRSELVSGRQETTARLNWRVETRGINFDHGVEYRTERRIDGSTLDQAFYAGAASLTRGPLSARAALRYGLSGESDLETYDVSIQYRLSDTLIVSTGMFRDQMSGLTGGNFGISRDLGFAFLNLGASWDDNGEYTIGAGLTVSFGFDSRGPRLSSRPQARMGAIEPFVFLDRGGDGHYQAGVDEPLADVQLLVNRYPAPAARTDAEGRAWLTGLAPGEPVRLGVDASSLPDAFLAPARAEIAVEPRPGRAFRLEIPIVESGEISGVVELLDDTRRAPLRGVRLELVDEQGEVRATAVSMFDGAWLFDQVPPGRWIVRAHAGQLVAGTPVGPAFVQTMVGPRSLTVNGLGFQFDARGGGLIGYTAAVIDAPGSGYGRSPP